MNYLSFKEFVEKYGLKDEITSNVKIKEILNDLKIPCGIYMRDDKFTTTSCIVNLHPSVGTHWVMYTNQNYFDSYGTPSPLKIMSFIKSAKLRGIYSEYKIQKDDSYRAAYCLYVLYLTKILGFKNAVLILYYQTFKLNKWRKLISIHLKIKLSRIASHTTSQNSFTIKILQKVQQRRSYTHMRKNYQKIDKNL